MRILLSFLLLALFVTSCDFGGKSVEEVEVSALEGRWELTEARRDNVKTTSLEGMYLNFLPDGELLTNLMGEEQRGTYTFDEEEIVTVGVEPALTYTINSLEGEEMVLQSRLEGFIFLFRLRRNGGDVDNSSNLPQEEVL